MVGMNGNDVGLERKSYLLREVSQEFESVLGLDLWEK